MGQTAQLVAEPLDAQGKVLSGRSVAWSSSRPNVATVSATGTITALSPGNTIITANVEGKSGVGAITVAASPVVSVAVSPTSATLTVGQTVQLGAQPRDASGRSLAGRTVTWSTNRSDVATVTSTGIVTAVSAGTATITASSEGRTATATMVVQPPGVSRLEITPANASVEVGRAFRLSATAYDSRGNLLPRALVEWASSDTRIATVDNSGRVLGVSRGSAIITARSGGKTASASVRVKRGWTNASTLFPPNDRPAATKNADRP